MEGIPDIAGPERFEKQDFIASKFVEVVTNEYFEVQMQYPLLGMKYAEDRCFVREEVYEMLITAAKALPSGMKFRILDAWRPFALQHELYMAYSVDIIKDFELENCTEEQKKAVVRRFVSDPVEDRDVPPVHTTGGAVDLTIIGEDGNELEMGTGFDAFTDKTCTAYFEKEKFESKLSNYLIGGSIASKACDMQGYKNETVRDNRRLLYHTMVGVGFTNLPSEWWHYDYGDRFWAFYNKKPAIYRGVFAKEEIG